MEKTVCSIQTRIAETDSLGVVYYSHFFTYFEVARLAFLKSIGCSENDLNDFFCRTYILEAHCVFKSPVQPLEEIEIEVQISELQEKTFKMTYKICGKIDHREIAEGYTIGIFIDHARKGVKIPNWFVMRVRSKTNPSS
jgi:acyl-CoA thioester hydrolase